MLCGTGEFSDRHFERHCGTQKHRDAVALAKQEKFCCEICKTGILTKHDYNRHCDTQKHKDAEIIFKRGQSKDACEMPDTKRHKEKDVECGKSAGDSPDGEEDTQIMSSSKRHRDSGSHDESDDDAADVADARSNAGESDDADNAADAGSNDLAKDDATNEDSLNDDIFVLVEGYS